ncbi:HYR domain-containing protein, partial [Arthrospira platensis SPKY1]|nr:HYR domain-containing protein [Arthrospira platensis SPKY1]
MQASTSEYTIAWSTGDSTLVIDSLTAGYFSVVVTDANGCAASLDSLLIEEVPDDELPVFTVCPSDLLVHSCDSTILYDLPEATDNCEVAIEQLEGLPSGAAFPTDTVLITYQAADPSGNTALCSFIILRIEDLAAEAVSQSVSCFGDNDGEITISITGGTGPYQILWSTGDTTETISGLSPGLYTATITDQGACVTEAIAEVTAPAAISIALDSIVAEAPP